MPRNGSGTYTLPAGNPVVSGTTIQSTWANSTLTDVADALTGSLARDGTGGMTGTFKVVDGSASLPGLSFTNEPSSGIYRLGAGEWWGVALTAPVYQVTTTGLMMGSSKLLQIQAGSVGAPSLTFASDNDTGMWSPAANTMAWSTEGVERLRLANTSMKVGDNALFVDIDDVQIGIGTGNPAYKIDARGNSGIGLRLLENETGNANQITIRQIGGLTTYENGYTTASTNAHVFNINGTTHLRLSATGLTQTASASTDPTFTIKQGTATTGNTSRLNFSDSAGTTAYIWGYGSTFGSGRNNLLGFGTDGTERMVIDGSGNVGIGRLPSNKFEVQGTTSAFWNSAATQFLSITPGAATTLNVSGTYQFNIGGTAQAYLTSTGLGVGVTPDTTLQIKAADPKLRILNSSNALAYGDISTTTTGQLVLSADPANNFGSTRISFYNDGTESAFISSSRLVLNTGIGLAIANINEGDNPGISTSGNVISGYYTPSIGTTTNVASSSVAVAQYMVVGNTVTVSGQVGITPTANGVATTFRLSGPVVANFTGDHQSAGVGTNATASILMSIQSVNGTSRSSLFTFTSTGTIRVNFQYTYTYRVIS